MWYQPSHTSHWIHCTVSCWGSRHRGAAHGSTAPLAAAPPSSSSSSSDEEEEEDEEEEPEEEEEAEEVEEEEEDDGEGREGRGGSGCFLGRPRRLLRGEEGDLMTSHRSTQTLLSLCVYLLRLQ